MGDERVVLITGGSGGIGEATAHAFAADGAKVVVADLDDETDTDVVTSISGAEFRRLDVRDANQWESVVDDVIERHGRLDVLVNNAGVWLGRGLLDTTPEEYRAVVEVNQVGVFLGMRAVAPAMISAGAGVIVNLSSTAGLQAGLPYWSPDTVAHAYTASKFAVRGMTKAAAFELAPHGVRVNSVHPGPIGTPMMHDAADAIAPRVPVGRMGEPSEVAAVIMMAAAPVGYMTGAELTVDGASTC